MEKTILHTNPNNSKCILFFNGWGMDSHAIKHLEAGEYDVFEFHDYSQLNVDSSEFEKYDEIYLIAWSMGVWVATNVFENQSISFTKKIAINGTEMPMHDSFGIANAVFEGTLHNWSEAVRTKFNIRMCGTRTQYTIDNDRMSRRTIENQQNELQTIYNQIVETKKASSFIWDIAIVGEQDFIFTSENQKNYWLEKVKCITLPIPHYPFARFNSWKEIITIGE